MKRILYSKSPDARAAFVKSYFEKSGAGKIAYLAPRKFIADVSGRRLPQASFHAYEDVIKSNTLFNEVDGETLLVFDRPSRYKLITSNTFVRLSRIAARYERKIMVDIVPFTTGIEYLYTPLAFIDRRILNYQHWYSFRENNLEITETGESVRAHDYNLLAGKLAPHVKIDYESFLENQTHVVERPMPGEERAEYQALRDRLFAENRTAGPIITTLADWTNIRPGRYETLKDLLSGLQGKSIVYTNLASHNRRLKKEIGGGDRSIGGNIEIKSFYDTNGDESRYDNVILFEVPIVRNYLFLDVIANIRPDCHVHIFRSDVTVDRYLFKKMDDEYTAINEFTKTLHKAVKEYEN